MNGPHATSGYDEGPGLPRRSRFPAIACIALAGWAATAGAFSGQGGKAEPRRIQFQRGHDNATVAGTLRGDAQAEYVFGARKGQRLTIRFSSSPPRAVTVHATDTRNVDLPLAFNARNSSSLAVAEDGDYEIRVARAAGTSGRVNFRVTVTIR